MRRPKNHSEFARREVEVTVCEWSKCLDGYGHYNKPVSKRKATVAVYIDVGAILDRLSRSAAERKSGKATALSGAVIVKCIKATDTPLLDTKAVPS